MKTKRTILLLMVLVVFAVAMTSCSLLFQHNEHVWEGGSCTEPRVCSVCHAVDENVLGHAEETVTGYAATCTETGLSDGTKCSVCDEVLVAQEEIAKLDHTPGAAATCTTGQECTVCHTEIAAALGHDIVVDEAIEADCLNSGLTAGEHCSRCDHKVDQEEVPALGHDIVKDAAKAPTCTENGLTAGEHCTKCDYNSVKEVAALGHNMVVDAAKAPTCTEDGLKEGSHCSRCDHKVAQEVDPALGHNIVKDEAKAPTCTETGLTEGEHCTRCDGATVAQQSVAALGHKYENFVCTECQAGLPALDVTDSFDFTTADGLDAALASGKLGYTGTFRNNGDSHQFAADSSIQFVVPANTIVTITGHSTGYGVFDVYLNGVKTDMAGVLSFTVTEETKVVILPDEEATYSKAYLKGIALEKFVDRTIVEDTTINFGSEGNYKDSIVDFSGIYIGDNGGNNSQVKNGSFDLLLKAGSKVVIHGYPGYTSYKLNDGEEITAEWYTYIALTDTVLTVTPVDGNNYFYSIEITLHQGVAQVEAKPADCENAGYEAYYSCTCHGELTEKVVLPALGHTEETLAGKAATCTEAGLTAGKKCSVCQKVLVAQTEIAAKGHTEEALAAKDPTCEDTGLTAGKKCSVCGVTLEAQKEIPALGHTFVSGICACGHKDPNYVNYHLVGYINGADYGCEADHLNPGEYKFVDGKLVAKFNNDSYIFIKTVNLNGKNVKWYLFETYHDASKTEGILYENKSEKMFVPGGVEVEFTLTVNDDGSLKLALEYHVHNYSEPTCTEPGKCSCGLTQGEATGHAWADATFDAPKTCSKCGATEGTALVAVATADGKKYQTLAEALEGGSEILLLANIELDAPIVLNGNYTIDLNGYTLSYTSEVMGEAMITNNGTFVINDSASNGVINYNYVGANDASYGKGNYTISNSGHLTVNGGKITIANLRQHAKYPIDNNSLNSDAVLVVNGGHLYNYNTSAIRMICSASHKNSVTVNGGLVEGYCAIWIQNPGKNTVNGELTITGGEIRTTAAAYVNGTAALKDVSSSIYCTIAADGGAWSESSFINISGGIFNENVELLEDAPVTTITAGTFNGKLNHVHTFVGATCTADGTCGCGAVGGKLGHTEQIVAGKAATCESTGLTEGKKCSACGETLVAQEEIPAKGHEYETLYVWADDNSTCTSKQICKNDASHVVEGETVTVSHIDLHVTASKVTFTYHAGEQTKVVESDLALENNIATIYAPAVEGRVASHDYVKYGFHDAAATYEFTIYYSELSVWDGVSVSEGLAGEGTLENPYLIQSAADFAYFASVINAVEGAAGVNYKVTTFNGQYFKMTKSVDLNGHSLIVGMHAGWNNYQGFFGSFDGNNCTIRGINITNDTTNSSALFGCIAKGGSVKNLSTYGTINGRVRLSGLVGYLLGTVDNITSYVTLNQTGTGNETGTVGGIVANQENSGGAITNCVNYGTITGQSYIFGGIVGSGGATIENCVNWGNVTAGNVSIGGISGSTKDKGTITGCVNYGTISTTSVEYGKVGGIVGSAVKPINNCVNYGDVIALHTAGGIAGDSTKEITGSVNYGKVIGVNCASYSLNQITPSNVTKTDCVENGSIVIPEHKLIHTDAKAATCEADGNVAYDNCSVCKKNYDADGKAIANVVISALGHAWDEGVVADGKITFTCKNDASHTRVEVAKVTITVNHLNLDGSVAAEAESLEFDYDTIATIYAKSIEGYVASHDYVKVDVQGDSSVTIYYSQVDVWDGTGVWDGTSNVATSLDALGGSGTKADPYIIDEAQDLVMIANIVNSLAGGTSSTLIKDKYFKMTKSIDLNNNPLYIGGFSGWGNRQIFNGHLDGNNCSIRGINNDRALFGCIEGTVSNLSLYGKVYSDKQVGNEAALVGYLRGHVHYITNYADVSGHTQVGGVIGNLESKTASTHLTNYGTIRSITAKGTWSAVGGLIGCVGYSHSDLVNWGDVYSVGSSAGGIGGYGHSSRAGNVTNAYNYGTVYCTYEDKGQILGLIASHTYVNCHENGEVVNSLPTEE